MNGKIKVISPVIDLVEFKSGRGNAFLASALPLAKSLHSEIAALSHRIESAAKSQEEVQHSSDELPNKEQLSQLITSIKQLLERIDREVPLLQLAITASGETLSTSVPAGISPSRLLQASTLLIIGDTQHAQNPFKSVQVGPVFVLSLYMLFKGHASTTSDTKVTPGQNISLASPSTAPETPCKPSDEEGKIPYGLGEGQRKPLWQEVIHKARVKLTRAAQPANTNQYEYYLEILQDLDDGRAHDQVDDADELSGITHAGLREIIPLHQISKIFYTDTGKILNIGDESAIDSKPILLLKRDVLATQDRRGSQAASDTHESGTDEQIRSLEDTNEQVEVDRQLCGEVFRTSIAPTAQHSLERGHGGLPKQLDPEWIALEMFEEDAESSEGSDDSDDCWSDEEEAPKLDGCPPTEVEGVLDENLVTQLQGLSLLPQTTLDTTSPPRTLKSSRATSDETQKFLDKSPLRALTTSLSLLEMLIRLAGLQGFQQTSHLTIPDHILTFFLEETSTTGLVGEAQWKVRNETKRRVGFDPYTGSPM